MNVKTAAEITALNSTDLKAYAKEIGVKRAASDTKADLTAKVLAKVDELRREAQEIAAMKAKAKIRTKVETAARAPKAKACTQQPCTRKVTENDMCTPHNEEGMWENTHEDEGHENLTGLEDDADQMYACWVCHPELNEATAAPRKSTSKAGMVILAKGTYHHKSELVRKAIEEAGGEIVKINHKDDKTQLLATFNGIEIVAGWTGDAFDYALASWDGKKYRNVKELVRLLGQA